MSKITEELTDVKLTFPLLYRTFMLIHVYKKTLSQSPVIQTTQEVTWSGKTVSPNQSRAYRRRAGRDSTHFVERSLRDYEKAWMLFTLRADDIAKLLYRYKLRDAGSAVFSFAKTKEKLGTSKAGPYFFRNKNYNKILPQILELSIKKARPNTNPSVSLFGKAVDIDGVMEGTVHIELGYPGTPSKYQTLRDILQDLNT